MACRRGTYGVPPILRQRRRTILSGRSHASSQLSSPQNQKDSKPSTIGVFHGAVSCPLHTPILETNTQTFLTMSTQTTTQTRIEEPMQADPPQDPEPVLSSSRDPHEPELPIRPRDWTEEDEIEYQRSKEEFAKPSDKFRQRPSWRAMFDKPTPDKGKSPSKPSGSKSGGGGGGGGDHGDDNDPDNPDDDDEEDESTPRRRNKGMKIKEPDPFTDRKYIRQFMQQIVLNFSANPRRFKTDKSKILFVLSYMTTGEPGQWAEIFIESRTRLVPTWAPVTWGSWADFSNKLAASFIDPNEDQKAYLELAAYTQKSGQSLPNTSSKLLNFSHDALAISKMAMCKIKILLRLLLEKVKDSYIDKMYLGEPPTTYDLFKESDHSVRYSGTTTPRYQKLPER